MGASLLTFLDRAGTMVDYGVPVVPLAPCQKFPPPEGWRDFATTDMEIIKGWLVPNGQPAIATEDSNCACVAKRNGFCFFEIDDMEVVSARIEKGTDHKLQELQTLIVQSSGEKRHFYFKQNDATRALGNFDYDAPDGAELFSFRGHNKYVVSPYSVHPDTGCEYQIVNNADIIEAPVWLTDWLKTAKHSSSVRKENRAADETAKIHEGGRDEFLFAKACELRDAKMSQKAALAALLVINNEQCVPPMTAEIVKTKIKSAYTREPRTKLSHSTETFVESGTSPTTPRREIISIRASEAVPVPIEFLWEPYLQQDALNAYYGNPSVGKGHTGIDHVACLTTGRPFPTESTTDRKPMNCVILAAEEGVANTIVPRLIAAKADLTRVRIVRSIRYHDEDDKSEDRLITFQQDMAILKDDLRAHPEERFLLVDPITNYVGDINFNQDGEVRPVLTQLTQLGEELRITILIVGHFNKNTNVGSALDKPGGGRAWTAVPRSVWGFFRHRDNKQQRVMVNLKMNNAEESNTGLLFTIGSRVIGTKPNGKPWAVGYVEWGDKTDMSADEMVAAEQPEVRRDSKGVDWLTAALKEGRRKATKMYEGAEAAQVSESTLDRAIRRVGVLKFKMHDGWYWQHPTDMTPIPDSARELNKEAKVRRDTQTLVEPEGTPMPQDEPAPEFRFTDVQEGEGVHRGENPLPL